MKDLGRLTAEKRIMRHFNTVKNAGGNASPAG
jgi:hypothetical protein